MVQEISRGTPPYRRGCIHDPYKRRAGTGDVVQAVDVAHEAPFGVCGCGLRTKSSYIVGLHLGEVNDEAAAGRFRAGLAADCRTACDSVSGGSFEDDGLFTGGLRLGRACRGVP